MMIMRKYIRQNKGARIYMTMSFTLTLGRRLCDFVIKLDVSSVIGLANRRPSTYRPKILTFIQSRMTKVRLRALYRVETYADLQKR